MSSSTFKGVVHGKTIELDQEPGLPDGQPVTVTVQPVPIGQKLPPGDGLRRSSAPGRKMLRVSLLSDTEVRMDLFEGFKGAGP